MKSLLLGILFTLTFSTTVFAAKNCDTDSGKSCVFIGSDGKKDPVAHNDTRIGKVTGVEKTCCDGKWQGGASMSDGFGNGGVYSTGQSILNPNPIQNNQQSKSNKK